jgi:hypothetical protein
VPAAVVLTDVFEPLDLLELLPPQPAKPIPRQTIATADNRTGMCFLDRRAISIKVSETKQRTVTEPGPKFAGGQGIELMPAAAAGVVVVISNVAVDIPPALSVTLAGLMAQAAFAGAPEQVRLTESLNDALADRVTVATAVCPGLTEVDCGVAESVNAGASAVTVKDAAVEVLGLKLASPL